MLLLASLLFFCLVPSELPATTAIFWEEGFPFIDTKPIAKSTLEEVLKNEEVEFLDHKALNENLKSYDLLVLPYGSAFPEASWPAIKSYLQNGGNLLILGGKPFATAVSDRARNTLAFGKELLINDTFEIPKKRLYQIASQKIHENFSHLALPPVAFDRAFAITARLSSQELYNRLGSWGSMDAKWEGLLYAMSSDSRPLVALVSYMDHFKNQFVGSRWVFANFEPKEGYWQSPDGQKVLEALVVFAKRGAFGIHAQPARANYRKDEKPAILLQFDDPKILDRHFEVELVLNKEGKPIETVKTFRNFKAQHFEDTFKFKSKLDSGFYEVLVTATEMPPQSSTYTLIPLYPYTLSHKTGFWLEDLKALSKGEAFSVNTHYLTRGGKSYPIIGTTYMASDVHRYFLLMPNPYIFEKDFAQLGMAGINMIRTGIWTGYDKLTNADGSAKEETLRALEAFLLSAKRHGIPVQFCFFSFIPDVFGGKNPYLDPEASRQQKNYILSFVNRFKNNPDLIWDLINEPSFSNPGKIFSGNVPNNDELELASWNEWLTKRHGSLEGVARAWNTSVAQLREQGALIPLPQPWEIKVNWNAIYWGWTKPLKAYDYNLFSQEKFNDWAREMTAAIRTAGSKQLITIGQDEGGSTNRILNHFYGEEVAFTTNHTWWQNDALLWDSVVSKRLDKPNLIQETGIMHTEAPDETARMDEEAKARLLEKKCALSLGAEAAGVIQWAWNINVYMRDDNEATIGAVRGDGTEKPEADVLSRFAKFVSESRTYLDPPQEPSIALVLPQSLQLSLYNDLAIEATQKAIRALHYHARHSAFVLSEKDLSTPLPSTPHPLPSLIILPSAQILSDSAWQGLLKLVEAGSTLLVTGPIERDEYFRPKPRISALLPKLMPTTLTSREVSLEINSSVSSPYTLYPIPYTLSFSYSGHKMNRLDFERIDGLSTLEEFPYGKGRVLVCPYPVELNDNLDSIGELYRIATEKAGIKSTFKTNNSNPGILIKQTVFPKAILYLLASETNRDQTVNVQDLTTGRTLEVKLPGERSALILLDKKTGQTLAQYQPTPF